MFKRDHFFIIFILLISFSVMILSPVCAASLKRTMYAGIWYPLAESANMFDKSIKDDLAKKLQNFVKKEIEKYPVIIQKLGLFFPDKQLEEEKIRIFTIVLSRATNTSNEYAINHKRFYQYFFDVTLSIVVVNPQTSQIDYSRILTGELPVLEARPLDDSKKRDYFWKILKKTIASLLKKAAEEFEINEEEGRPDCYFQVVDMKINPKSQDKDAKNMSSYENDLKQFLHDALIFRAKEKGLNICFLPIKSQWDDKIWLQFKDFFGTTTVAETNEGYYGNKKAASLIEEKLLLTITGILQKTQRSVIKENNLEAYYAYLAYAAGGVVLRDKEGKKIAVYPTKMDKKKRLAKGSACIEFHDVKGTTKSASHEYMFLDSAQKAMSDLSKELIVLCDLAGQELLAE